MKNSNSIHPLVGMMIVMGALMAAIISGVLSFVYVCDLVAGGPQERAEETKAEENYCHSKHMSDPHTEFSHVNNMRKFFCVDGTGKMVRMAGPQEQ